MAVFNQQSLSLPLSPPFRWISKTSINNAGMFEATKTRDSEWVTEQASMARESKGHKEKLCFSQISYYKREEISSYIICVAADRRRGVVKKDEKGLQDGMIMTGGITQQLFRGWKRGHKSISHRLWHNAELRELRGISCAHRGSCWAKLILVKEKKEKNWHYRGTERKTEGERGSQLWGFKYERLQGTGWEEQKWRQISGERKKDGDKEVRGGRVAAGRFRSMLLWYWLSNWWASETHMPLRCRRSYESQSRLWQKPFKPTDTIVCKQTWINCLRSFFPTGNNQCLLGIKKK